MNRISKFSHSLKSKISWVNDSIFMNSSVAYSLHLHHSIFLFLLLLFFSRLVWLLILSVCSYGTDIFFDSACHNRVPFRFNHFSSFVAFSQHSGNPKKTNSIRSRINWTEKKKLTNSTTRSRCSVFFHL